MMHYEKQADQLWAQFDKRKQDSFWLQYDTLVSKSRKAPVPKKNTSKPLKASKQTTTQQTVFHPHTLFLTKKVFFLMVPVLIVVLIITFDPPKMEATQAIVFSFLGLVVLSLYGFFLFIEVNTIRVSKTHLTLGNPTKAIPWHTIKSVVVNSYLNIKENVDYDFIVTTQDQFQHARVYKLSKENHQRLFSYIAQKVTTVDEGNYPGYGV